MQESLLLQYFNGIKCRVKCMYHSLLLRWLARTTYDLPQMLSASLYKLVGISRVCSFTVILDLPDSYVFSFSVSFL